MAADPQTLAHPGLGTARSTPARRRRSRHAQAAGPDDCRAGREEAIFDDWLYKLPRLSRRDALVLEIGPGCGRLQAMLSDHCADFASRLLLVDRADVLCLLPDRQHQQKIAGSFPDALGDLEDELAGQVDVVLAYNVVQQVFAEGNLWDFLDRSLALLREGGELLLGDIPNTAMCNRFLASAAGQASHQAMTAGDDNAALRFNKPVPGQMDDSVVLGLLARARAQGVHAWVLPQWDLLPMANRREYLLFRKP